MKVVLAIDSFKGCATSAELSGWMREAILEVDESIEVQSCTIADGGEGMLEAMLGCVAGRRVKKVVNGPLMEPVEAEYGILEDGVTAIIEMAQAAGLPLVPLEKRNPLHTTTYGVGELVLDALEKGCRTFVIGLGGSATNDAGLGMMQALGCRFLDASGTLLGVGGAMLENVETIDTTQMNPLLKACSFVAACDVDNVMCGPRGSAYVYGPQKGADALMIERLDSGMKHLCGVMKKHFGYDVSMHAGTGAAGSFGGGLQAFLGASLKPGIDILLDQMGFDAMLNNASLVITGEGRIDEQSLMGKVLSGISKRCQHAHIPIIALCGGVSDALGNHEGVDAIFSIMRYPMRLDEAMEKERTRGLIAQTTKEIFRLIKAVQRESE